MGKVIYRGVLFVPDCWLIGKEEANNYLKPASGCNMLLSCSFFFFFNISVRLVQCTLSTQDSALKMFLLQSNIWLRSYLISPGWIKSRWKLIIVFKCTVPPDNMWIKSGLQCLCEMDFFTWKSSRGNFAMCVSHQNLPTFVTDWFLQLVPIFNVI